MLFSHGRGDNGYTREGSKSLLPGYVATYELFLRVIYVSEFLSVCS